MGHTMKAGTDWVAYITVGALSLLVAEGMTGWLGSDLATGARSSLVSGVMFAVAAGLFLLLVRLRPERAQEYRVAVRFTGAVAALFLTLFAARLLFGA
jgi:hypothetical protein